MGKFKNYYNILGITKDASEDDIKKAYKKLVIKYHPDKIQNKKNISEDEKKKANDKYNEIEEAYQTLINPKDKDTYDNTGRKKRKGPKREFVFGDGAKTNPFRGLFTNMSNVKTTTTTYTSTSKDGDFDMEEFKKAFDNPFFKNKGVNFGNLGESNKVKKVTKNKKTQSKIKKNYSKKNEMKSANNKESKISNNNLDMSSDSNSDNDIVELSSELDSELGIVSEEEEPKKKNSSKGKATKKNVTKQSVKTTKSKEPKKTKATKATKATKPVKSTKTNKDNSKAKKQPAKTTKANSKSKADKTVKTYEELPTTKIYSCCSPSDIVNRQEIEANYTRTFQKGNKLIQKDEELLFTLPHEHDVRFPLIMEEYGDVPELGKKPADLEIELSVIPENGFSIEDNNLWYKMDLTMSEALKGCTKVITHPSGKKIEVKVEPLEKSGNVQTIDEEGLYGDDLYIRFDVDLTTK